jgi:hypothetical protein
MQQPETLYRRVLGDQFDKLPPVLKRFHGSPEGGRAHGNFRVTRGPGWLRNALANLLGFPRAGAAVPVRLEVAPEGTSERWYRHFPDRKLSSLQWANGPWLEESFGMGAYRWELLIEGKRLTHEFRQARVAGIPVPRALAPFVNGWVDADDSGWTVVVHIFFPLLGEIVGYEGRVEPD